MKPTTAIANALLTLCCTSLVGTQQCRASGLNRIARANSVNIQILEQMTLAKQKAIFSNPNADQNPRKTWNKEVASIGRIRLSEGEAQTGKEGVAALVALCKFMDSSRAILSKGVPIANSLRDERRRDANNDLLKVALNRDTAKRMVSGKLEQFSSEIDRVIGKYEGKKVRQLDPSMLRQDISKLLDMKFRLGKASTDINANRASLSANSEDTQHSVEGISVDDNNQTSPDNPDEADKTQSTSNKAGSTATKLTDFLTKFRTWKGSLNSEQMTSLSLSHVHVLNTGGSPALALHARLPKFLRPLFKQGSKKEVIASTEKKTEAPSEPAEVEVVDYEEYGNWGMHFGYAFEDINWDDSRKPAKTWIAGFNNSLGDKVFLNFGWAQSFRDASEHGVYVGVGVRLDRALRILGGADEDSSNSDGDKKVSANKDNK